MNGRHYYVALAVLVVSGLLGGAFLGGHIRAQQPGMSSQLYRVVAGDRGDDDLSGDGCKRFSRDVTVPVGATDEQIWVALGMAMQHYQQIHPGATHLSVTAFPEDNENAAAHTRVVWAPGGTGWKLQGVRRWH